MSTKNSIFISYSHHDTGAERVIGFYEYLHDFLPNKINILLDKKKLRIGKNIPNFIDQLKECPVIIVLLTPQYKRSLEAAIGGVFIEYEIIRNRVMEQDYDLMLLPILFEGTQETSVPEMFKHFIFDNFVDFNPHFNEKSNRMILQGKNKEYFFPLIKAIAKQIESKIDVRTPLPEKKYQEMLDRLFAKTKFNRDWIREHPEFLNHLFVSTRSYERVKSQDALFLIGRKGSGKSTISNTLPELESDYYKACIPILADHINLLSAVKYINPKSFTESFFFVTDKHGDFSKEFMEFNPLHSLFKYAWLGLIYICFIDQLYQLGAKGALNKEQMNYYKDLKDEFDHFTFRQREHIDTSKYFSLTSAEFLEFWNDNVTKALDNSNKFFDVIRFIESNVNEEQFLLYLLGNKMLTSLRKISELCDKHIIMTLDDFDSAFSISRDGISDYDYLGTIKRTGYKEQSVESAWIHSLMMLVLEIKGYKTGRGWKDIIFDKMNFCITIPKDSYLHTISFDRDAYLDISCTTDLVWTGVYLAKMLMQRLCYIFGEVVCNADDFSELNRIINTYIPALPTNIKFEFNGKIININLFSYVLRHTFWRPRDVLTYYAALLTAAYLVPDGHMISNSQIRKLIGIITRNIVKAEFIGEFSGTIKNLNKILSNFLFAPQVICFNEVYSRISEININVDQNNIITDIYEKIRLLYDIGFLGIRTLDHNADNKSNSLIDVFYFNEEYAVINSLCENNMIEDCSFIIHPIFSETLQIDCANNEFILNWDEEYLRDNHLAKTSTTNPG